MWVEWHHTAEKTLVRGNSCTGTCAVTMKINLNLFNMGLSTDINQPLSTAATTCTGTSPAISCAPSHLGFYLTFLNSNTATASALFADAFLGFLEFTPIPAVAAGKDNI